jgi:hypothetical protein
LQRDQKFVFRESCIVFFCHKIVSLLSSFTTITTKVSYPEVFVCLFHTERNFFSASAHEFRSIDNSQDYSYLEVHFDFLRPQSILFLHWYEIYNFLIYHTSILILEIKYCFELCRIIFDFMALKTLLFLHLYKISVRFMYHIIVLALEPSSVFWVSRLIFDFLSPHK